MSRPWRLTADRDGRNGLDDYVLCCPECLAESARDGDLSFDTHPRSVVLVHAQAAALAARCDVCWRDVAQLAAQATARATS